MFVIGIDGGQTGTTCLLASLDGRILGRGLGGHLVHLAQPQGAALLEQALAAAVADAWRAAGLTPQPCAAAYLGLSGVEAGAPEAAMAESVARALVITDTIVAANDSTSALAGALLGKPGVVLIAGTGAIARGRNEAGAEAFAGGWGWLLGDEGSAAFVGREGLLASLRAWDGRGPPTRLVESFERHFDVPWLFDLKRIIYARAPEARLFADLAPLVVQAATEGDQVARRVVQTAAFELAGTAAAVIARLQFSSPIVPVAPIGGVFRAGVAVLSPFRRSLRRLEPRAHVVAAALPGACGALILALRASNHDNPSIITRLTRSARRLGWANVE